MRRHSTFSALRWFSLLFILAGVILFVTQLVRFSRLWSNFPTGLEIAGIPAGQLTRQQAAERLLSAYAVPVELHYGEAVIQLSPSVVGFQLDLDNMLAAADLERTNQPFWAAFWNYLWGSPSTRTNIPLRVTLSEERLRNYLRDEVAARYDQPPTPAMPVVGTVSFKPGTLGTALDIERSIPLVEGALRSPNQRVVFLPLQRTTPSRPAFGNLAVLLKQTVDISEFDGLMGVYLLDLQSGQDLHFLYQQGEEIAAQPDAVFSASSTIKIPIMISVFRKIDAEANADDEGTAEALNLLEEMIVKSGNPPADQLMETYLDFTSGPLEVTRDMRLLGLENTFLAGYFYNGAPLLEIIKTPANQRAGVLIDPDPYSQTTVSEMGMLMGDIYQCARQSGGTLLAVFPGEITPGECEMMLKLLLKNHIAVLIQAGVADGTPVAHKHGWVPDPYGIIHDVSDAAIVFSPGGNYALVVFLYHQQQIVWPSVSELVKDLSKAVFNFYNLPSP